MSNSSDDVVWQIINQQFCAYKLTTPQKESFCRNEYNVNGVCSRATCPLANARYATVRQVDGRVYLYMKTAERQHLPNKWWERIKLSRNYEQALQQIDDQLIYWPSHLIDKCKQRLTRLLQVAATERRLALKETERQYTTKAPKVKRREMTRERKALIAAKLEKSIEAELLDRLKSGAYGDQPLNVEPEIWERVLASVKEKEQIDEQISEIDEESESESENELEFVADQEEDEIVDIEDLEKWFDEAPGPQSQFEAASDSESGSDSESDNGSKRRAHLEIEFEDNAQRAV